MAVTVYKTFAAGEILTASDLNSSFSQIVDNGEDLGWPSTQAKDMNGTELILDADADTSITADTDDQIDFRLGGSDRIRMLVTNSMGEVRIIGGDTGSSAGPYLVLDRNSASPADNDSLGEVVFRGRDDTDTNTDYVILRAEAADVTDATEDARLLVDLLVGGTAKTGIFRVGSGQNATLASDDSGATVGPTLTLHRNSSTPADADVLGALNFDGEDDGSGQTTYAQISAIANDVTDTTEDGGLILSTMAAGTLTEFGRIAGSAPGSLLVGKTSSTLTTAGAEIATSGRIRSTVDGAVCIEVNRLTSDGTLIDLQQAGSSVGSLHTGSTGRLRYGLEDGTALFITSGTGSPETVVTANVGSLFLRTDGGVSTTLYVKTSGTGNTGWTAK